MFLSILVLTTVIFDVTLAFPCPIACDCRDNNVTVFCNRTGIAEIPKDIPLNTITLNLAYNSIKSIPTNALKKLTKLQNLDLSGNQFKDTSFQNGALNVSSIQTLGLSGGGYMSIPKGLPPNVTTLYFFDNPITTLSSDSFIEAHTLQYLELRYNKIKTIEEHTFDPLVDAIEIDISFNKLIDGSFSPMIFVKNQKLGNVQFRFNTLQTFPNLTYFPKSLHHIDFVGNQIKIIPSFAFLTLSNLQTIEVWQGAITTVEDNAFYGLSHLTILDFMQDHVSSTLTNKTFNGLTGLTELFFDLNNVSKIERGAFRGMPNIQQLWFSSNRLSTLELGAFDLKLNPKISLLYIDDNPWICDCHLRWLRELLDSHPGIIQDPHLIVCNEPTTVAGKAWDELKPTDFVCKE